MEDKIKAVLDTLERAQNGFRWYREAHPEDDSGADDEMYAEIEESIATLTQMQAAVGEQEPVGRVDSVSTPFGDKLKPVLEKPVPVGTKLFAAPVAQQSRQINALSIDSPITFGGCPFCGRRSCVAGQCQHEPVAQPQFVECSYGADGYTCCEGGPCAAESHNDKVAQQLEDFEEGQWWLKELDAMVKDGTPDQKRAVAVVRNLMATAKAPQQVEDEPYMYISRNQFEKNHVEPEDASGKYLPVRKTPAGRFTCPLYLKPQEAARVEWGIDWGTHGDRTCVSIIKKHPDGITEVVASEYEPEGNTARKAPQQAAVKAQEPVIETEPLRLAGLTLIGLAEHDQYCAVFDLDDEGKHCNCNCGLAGAIATITQAGKTAAPVAQQPQAETDDSIAADAYGMACDEMERWQHERRKAGKDAGTTGSLVDGIAWLYGYIDDLEAKQPQAEAAPEVRSLLDRHERAWHRMGELWERCQGKSWPEAESNEFARLRDELAPAIRKQLTAIAAPQQAETVPPDYKLLKDTTHDERSWPEDYSHENGAYYNTCVHCLRQFTGYKRRVVCKVCDAALAAQGDKA